MYREHRCFESIPDEFAIWRYIDAARLYSLLDRSALFFCRASRLQDPWEGAFPRRQRDANLIRLDLEPDVLRGRIGASDAERISHAWAEMAASSSASMARQCAVSCWHINDFESEALWKLYAERGSGVAVRTTFGRLKKSFANCDNRNVKIGRIKYVDYERELIPTDNAFYPILYKRLSFERERELRAVIWEIERDSDDPKIGQAGFSNETGEYVAVDLSMLVESVFVSPASPPWFQDVIVSMLGRHGLSVPCHRSGLYDPP